MSFCEFFDRYSLTIARWLTTSPEQRATPENYTTPRDVTVRRLKAAQKGSPAGVNRQGFRLARCAHRQFRGGQFMTLLAALFVAISAVLLAYGPRAAADKLMVLLSNRDSSQNDLIVTGCGKLIEATRTTITYQPGNRKSRVSRPTNWSPRPTSLTARKPLPWLILNWHARLFEGRE